jgi:hypothetical protein
MKWVSYRESSQKHTKGKSRISEDSFLYGKVVPIILIGLVFLALLLILIATGVLVGIIPNQ